MNQQHGKEKKNESTILKEIFFGLLAVALGVYNLLNQIGVLTLPFEIPQLIGNVLLVVVGLVLLATAFKLWRYKWHTSRMF